jgi:hypothetical protein
LKVEDADFIIPRTDMQPKHGLSEVWSTARWPIATIGLALVIISGTSASQILEAASEYDATSDFEVGWDAGSNPNGVWSYGWTHGIDGTLTLFTRNHMPAVNNNREQMWDDPTNSFGFTPSVARNAGGDFDNGNVTLKEGALIMHPGGSDGADYAHVIWTATEDGDYALTSTFFAQQNGINVDVHVLVNGVSVYDETITNNGVSRAFSETFSISSGSTIVFAVGPNGDFRLHPGNTGLDATIRKLSSSTRSESENRRSRNDIGTMHATPNPFTAEFTLHHVVASSPSRVRISDLMGRVVQIIEVAYPSREIILGSELTTGVYFVEIMQGRERRGMLVHKVK